MRQKVSSRDVKRTEAEAKTQRVSPDTATMRPLVDDMARELTKHRKHQQSGDEILEQPLDQKSSFCNYLN